MSIGWIGLGKIGFPMALRLRGAGYTVTAFDIEEERLTRWGSVGGVRSSSAAAAVSGAEAVFLSLPDTDCVEEVVFGTQGVAKNLPADALIVDTSTIHAERSRRMAERAHEEFELSWVDAPVSGGPDGATSGSLSAFLGGSERDISRATPWISSFASKITRIGGSGSGQIAKTCNQSVVGATIAAWSEVLDYAIRNGLDPLLLTDALAGSSSDSEVRKIFISRMASGSFPGSAMMFKDLKLIREASDASEAAMPINRAAVALFKEKLGI